MSTENLYTPGCIRTFTGKYINPCKPDPDLIYIEDIAHALSMQPRFGGHLPVFYSVAQHCVEVMRSVSGEIRMGALLHDASEAYLIDVPRPVKEQLLNYREIECTLMEVIADKFGFQWPLHEDIKAADEMNLQKEWDCLMLGNGSIPVWNQDMAKAEFLIAYRRLEHIETIPELQYRGPSSHCKACEDEAAGIKGPAAKHTCRKRRDNP